MADRYSDYVIDDRKRLFDAETTRLVFRPAMGIDANDVLAEAVIDIPGEVSDKQLDQLLVELAADGWWTDRIRKNTQWGAQSSFAEIVVQFMVAGIDETLWILIGVAIDRVIPTRPGHGPLPEESRAVNAARLRILKKYRDVHAASLELVSTAEDAAARKRTFRYRDPIYEYEVVVHSTPSGLPFVTGIGRDRRKHADQ